MSVIEGIIIAGNRIDSTVVEHIDSTDINKLILFIYLVVASLLLFRTVYGVIEALRIIRKGRVINSSFPRIILSDSEEHLFSFYPFIVVPEKLLGSAGFDEIVEHEKVHVKQYHTFDLLFCEFLVSLQWFNPFIWLIKRSIVLNHEYLADNVSIVKSPSRKEYQYKLLNLSVQMAAVRLTHSFSSSIKKRLIMINRKPTQSYAAIKGLLIIPVVAILFLFFAFKAETGLSKSDTDDPLFSKSSIAEIYKYLFDNILYPQEAKDAGETGSVFVLVKIGKGGVMKECKVISDPAGAGVPIFDEVVIVGYGSASSGNYTDSKNPEQLAKESLRIAKNLTSLDIPEWKEKDAVFILNFKFMLK